MWRGKDIAFLLLLATPSPCLHQFIGPNCRMLSRVIIWSLQHTVHLSDAVGVAKLFVQCSISLSVISPKKLPKLRAIYNAGRRDAQAMDLPIDNPKNPQFLVLISENFVEARAALSRYGITNLSTESLEKVDAAPIPSVFGPPSTSIASASGAVMNRKSVSVGSIPHAGLKIEPITLTSTVGLTFPYIPSVPHAALQAIPNLQTSSPISVSQDMVSTSENVQEMKANSGMLQPRRPIGGSAANVRILNDVAQARQALTGGTFIGLPSRERTPKLSNMISRGMISFVRATQTRLSPRQSRFASVTGSVPLAGNVHLAHSPAPSFLSTSSNLARSSNLSMAQPLSNFQGSVSMDQMVPSKTQGKLPGTKMVQSGIGMNRNMMSAIGASSGIASGTGTGTGTMIPTPGMSQVVRPGMQPLGLYDNPGANMPPSPQSSSSLQSAQSNYAKVWELSSPESCPDRK